MKNTRTSCMLAASMAALSLAACPAVRTQFPFDTLTVPSGLAVNQLGTLGGYVHTNGFFVANVPSAGVHVRPASPNQYIVTNPTASITGDGRSYFSVFIPGSGRKALSFTVNSYNVSCAYSIPGSIVVQFPAKCDVYVTGYNGDTSELDAATNPKVLKHRYRLASVTTTADQMSSGDVSGTLKGLQFVKFSIVTEDSAAPVAGAALGLQLDNVDLSIIPISC